MTPVLSIIIPVYNVEQYVADCLRSVLRDGRERADYEVIVVNDGTPDNSMEVVRELCSGRDDVSVLEQENRGLSAARNAGLAKARGEYVWFVDSDDWLVPDGIDELIALLRDDPRDLYVTPLLKHNPEAGADSIDISQAVPRTGEGRKYLRDRSFPCWAAPRYIIRRDLFESPDLFFPEELLHEDEYFGRVLLYSARSVRLLERPVYIYRVREGSITTVPKIKSSEDILKIHEMLMSFCRSEVRVEDKGWFEKDALRLIRCGFTRNEKLYSTAEFKSFRRRNLRYILNEYEKYGKSLSLKERWSDYSLFLCPRLHTRLYYFFEPMLRGK